MIQVTERIATYTLTPVQSPQDSNSNTATLHLIQLPTYALTHQAPHAGISVSMVTLPGKFTLDFILWGIAIDLFISL